MSLSVSCQLAWVGLPWAHLFLRALVLLGVRWVCCVVCFAHCRISSIPGPYPLNSENQQWPLLTETTKAPHISKLNYTAQLQLGKKSIGVDIRISQLGDTDRCGYRNIQQIRDQTEMGTDEKSWGITKTIYDKPHTLLQIDTISKLLFYSSLSIGEKCKDSFEPSCYLERDNQLLPSLSRSSHSPFEIWEPDKIKQTELSLPRFLSPSLTLSQPTGHAIPEGSQLLIDDQWQVALPSSELASSNLGEQVVSGRTNRNIRLDELASSSIH